MFRLLKKLTSKKDREDPNSSLSQIKTHMVTLNEKATALPDLYSEEKEKIASICEIVRGIKPETNPTALKFEHNILERLTTAHYSCSQAIIGRKGDEFKKDVASLAHAVKQRTVFEK
ncbi:hypothetical protein [Treponema sp.]|uniref:hypothetical protein n=1 Tax=Treponema sp. TaxID=166 RepID=UPI0026009BB6|nr:hypothetical protein [Treponema sp.]MCR5218490.1 hypothetical protein [Treponema sp.]